MEIRLIKTAILSRDAYGTIVDFDVSETITDKGKLILDEIGLYYERDLNATHIDQHTLMNLLKSKYPRHEDAFDDIFSALPADISPANIVAEIIEAKKQQAGYELANALLSNGDSKVHDLIDTYLSYSNFDATQVGHTDSYIDMDISTLFEERGKGWILAPKVLNDKLDGGIFPGDNILFFGTVEVGKSAAMINAACGFLAQGLRVLYVGNEDSAFRMLPRFVSRLTKMPKHDILLRPDHAMQLAREKGYANLAFAHMSPGTFTEIERQVESFKPEVVMIDQIRHLHTGKGLERVAQLERAGTLARELASRMSVAVVSCTQANASAYNRAILELQDVDSSKTGLPGSMDIIIGIGCDQQMEQSNMRVLSIVKNKTGGGHTAVRVKLNPLISLITGE